MKRNSFSILGISMANIIVALNAGVYVHIASATAPDVREAMRMFHGQTTRHGGVITHDHRVTFVDDGRAYESINLRDVHIEDLIVAEDGDVGIVDKRIDRPGLHMVRYVGVDSLRNFKWQVRKAKQERAGRKS